MAETNVMPGEADQDQEIVLMKKQLKIQKRIAGFIAVMCLVIAVIGGYLAVRLSGTLTVLDHTLKDLDQTVETLDMDQVNDAVNKLDRTMAPIVDLLEGIQDMLP